MKSLILRAVFETVWGEAGLAWSERGVCQVVLPGLSGLEIMENIKGFYPQSERGNPGEVEEVIKEVRAYFRGEAKGFSARPDLLWASPFQRSVYHTLMRIPYAETWSYARVAKAAGCPGAGRAVGRANAANRVPLIVPCHRVIKSDGSLGGFSGPGGTDMKQKLLDLERNSRGVGGER